VDRALFGPQLPVASRTDAAPQLTQTGHPCIAQHSPYASGGNADLSAVRCACSVRAATAKAFARVGGEQTAADAAEQMLHLA